MIGILLFVVTTLLLFFGFPISFTFAAVSVIFGFIYLEPTLFAFMPFRIMNIMENTILMAIPLFIYMGNILQKTDIASRLLESMGELFCNFKGGLAFSVMIVGSFLAASTGVVGASVVAMGVISLPVMLKHNYDKNLSTGVICAAGTLGQIIPPSIILILLGDVMGLPVGDLFKSAMLPGFSLVFLYILYIFIVSNVKKGVAPPIPHGQENFKKVLQKTLFAIIPPLLLILIVLGSIYNGIATPTESSAVGCMGAVLLSILYKKFSIKLLHSAALESIKATAMVFGVLIGATAFSMVFTYSGAETIVEEFLLDLPGGKFSFLFFAMGFIFLLGFFIDFVEICFIIVPILAPIAEKLGFNSIWFAILIAMNLQTSFLTPPFGFSLFYLKGVAPKNIIKTTNIYKGVIPFILIQVFLLLLIIFKPNWFGL